MRPLFLLVLLFALMGQSGSEEPAGLVWLGFKSPVCGGILIEPDVVISAKSCLRSDMEVIWPFRGEIRFFAKPHPDANLVIFFLVRSWPNSIQLIHTSELSSLKQMLHVYFSNEFQSTENWIHVLEPTEFTPFAGLSPTLLGSPVWTDFGRRTMEGFRAVGMMIGEKKALRLDPYFNYISTEIKSYREQKYEAPTKSPSEPLPVVISAQTQTQTYISIPAQVIPIDTPIAKVLPEIEQQVPKQEPKTEPIGNNSPVLSTQPPKSLGCSCSQVRRFRR